MFSIFPGIATEEEDQISINLTHRSEEVHVQEKKSCLMAHPQDALAGDPFGMRIEPSNANYNKIHHIRGQSTRRTLTWYKDERKSSYYLDLFCSRFPNT